MLLEQRAIFDAVKADGCLSANRRDNGAGADPDIPDPEDLDGLVAKGWMVDSDGDGFLELVDGWGNKIAYAAYVKRDDDFTDDDFFPSSNRPLFMSAGPDGKFGSFAPQNQADDAAKDNLRSDQLKAGTKPVK